MSAKHEGFVMKLLDQELCGHILTKETADGVSHQIKHQLYKTLRHVYPTPPLGARSIPLYSGAYTIDGAEWEGDVALKLEPKPHLSATGTRATTATAVEEAFMGAGSMWVEETSLAIASVDHLVTTPMESPTHPQVPPAGHQLSEYRVNHAEIGNPSQVSGLTFFVLNGWQAHDGVMTCHDRRVHSGRVTAVPNDWHLTIDPRGDVSQREVHRHIKQTGDHTVTHIGYLRKADGRGFDARHAVATLDLITHALTFAMGRAIGCLVPIATSDGAIAWTSWGQNRGIDQPITINSWLDPACAAAQIAEVIEACAQLERSDPDAWEAFRLALGYYLSASRDTIANMKVLHPISALTLLWRAYQVRFGPLPDDPNVDRGACGGTTEYEVRRLLSAIGLNDDAPGHLAFLRTAFEEIAERRVASGGEPPVDSLSVVIKLRNDAAHPENRQSRRWLTEQWAEAGFFIQDRLDLALLHWIGYNGRYRSRIAESRGEGQSAHVPWSAGGRAPEQ